jgi:hypothetical protein
LLEMPGEHPKITKTLSASFQKLYIYHREQLKTLIEESEKDIQQEIKKILKQRIKDDSVSVKELIQKRIKEINKRLNELGLESGSYQTLITHFTGEERDQFEQDNRWLQLKISDLEKRIPDEEERIKHRYTMSSFMSFPIGVLYLIRESEVRRDA